MKYIHTKILDFLLITVFVFKTIQFIYLIFYNQKYNSLQNILFGIFTNNVKLYNVTKNNYKSNYIWNSSIQLDVSILVEDTLLMYNLLSPKQ